MPGGLERMFETVETFTQHWRFNASLHAVVESAGLTKAVVDAVFGGLLLAVLCVIAWRSRSVWPAAGAYLLAALLLSSTVHPWYVLWPLALVPMSREAGAWVLAITVPLAHAAWLTPADLEVPVWLRVVEYAPVYAAVGWRVWGHFWGDFRGDFRGARRVARRDGGEPPVTSPATISDRGGSG